MANTKTATCNWTTDPEAQRALSAIDAADLYITMDQPIVGPDRLVWTGEPLEILNALHEAAVYRIAGFANCDEAYAHDKCERLFAVINAQPTVQDVLCERFGDPWFWQGHGENRADAMHRADPTRLKREQDAFQQAYAQQVAA